MTKYREILRLHSMNLSQVNIAASCGVSKKTVNKVLKVAREHGVSWPIDDCNLRRRAATDAFDQRPPCAQNGHPNQAVV